MGKIKDLRGMKFGRLTVVEFAGIRNHKAYWVCRCDCGTIARIQGSCIRDGRTQSCGCFNREQAGKNMVAWHRMMGHKKRYYKKVYGNWRAMRSRCYDINHHKYHQYGGRGIEVCKEWKNDYLAFERWALANGWCEGLTLDRIDNDKGYCPENCRWATPKEQCNNQRRNIVVEFRRKQQTLSQWADESGIKYATLLARHHAGWSVERMLTTPVKTTKQKSEPRD